MAINWNSRGTSLKERSNILILDEMYRLGRPLTPTELKDLGFKNIAQANRAMNILIGHNEQILGFDKEGVKLDGSGSAYDSLDTRSDRDKSFNDYWQDVYDYKEEGTAANNVYSDLADSYQTKAETDQWLADAIYQQQALQQGAVVKKITDQVRNERMARLRAGMSETQIANQDMQMMMANMNAVNDQMNQYAASNIQAQADAKNAKASAYNDYLQWSATAGQNASAGYAAQVGDADYATRKVLDATYGVGGWGSAEYNKQYLIATGQGGK